MYNLLVISGVLMGQTGIPIVGFPIEGEFADIFHIALPIALGITLINLAIVKLLSGKDRRKDYYRDFFTRVLVLGILLILFGIYAWIIFALLNFLVNILRKARRKRAFNIWLKHQPTTMLGIEGWNELGGTLPGGKHGYGCGCWSCRSQSEDMRP